MSYSRFGWDGSDVYVFLSVGGHLECCGCLLSDEWSYATTDEMIAHLEEHRAAGHHVPEDCIEDLLADKEENDRWIANFDPVEEQRKNEERNQRITDIWQIAKEELGYVHPGPEKFDGEAHQDAWQRASEIYEQRKQLLEAVHSLPSLETIPSTGAQATAPSKRLRA